MKEQLSEINFNAMLFYLSFSINPWRVVHYRRMNKFSSMPLARFPTPYPNQARAAGSLYMYGSPNPAALLVFLVFTHVTLVLDNRR